ncbi:MAG: hypothetical protein BMS9Abin31_0861 [Gammaproteobacteria bacterium]|nr:MAG: hypothetical protein BMS9Abin31_0861 [Gammaproteobacteria bacterium]
MLKYFLLLVFIFISQQSVADSIHLIVNGKAFHENKKNYNENNWGLGFEYDFEEKKKWINFVNGGYFKDSLSNTSKYFGGGSKRRFLLSEEKDGWHIDAGFTAFMMTRKDYKNNQPFFGALPFVSIGTGKFAINATYIPKASPKLEALLFIQASFRLSEW